MKSRTITTYILLIALSVVWVWGLVSPAKADSEISARQVFDVTIPSIPFSSAELVNPMRGLYTFYDKNAAPTPRPPFLNYRRFFWSAIETSPHHFDFSQIDAEIKNAVAVNGKVAFRIMPCTAPGSAATAIGVPSDFPTLLKKGYFITETSGSQSWRLYVPDYNDPIYIARAKELIDALAAKYNGDPRIAYVEAGLIGTWGEGNYSQMPNPTPSGARPPFFGTAVQIIDHFCARFGRTRIVVPTDIFMINPTQPDETNYAASFHNALEYALLMHKNVGMFRNSLGDPVTTQNWFTAPFANTYVIAAGGEQRWQYAPFCAEWFGPPKPISPQLVLGAAEIQQTHAALVCNGALGPASLASADIQQLQTCGKLSGYRFQLDRVTGTNIGGNARRLNLTSYWENVGVAPTYDSWTVIYKLSPLGSGTDAKVVWQSASRLDLCKLMPTNGTPLKVQDSLQIPLSVPPGSYQLSVAVEDSAKYYSNPLALASAGIQPDGSYNITVIQIPAATH